MGEKKLGHSVKKAMILAAGLGTRMAPVTDSIPKPLVPILNVPNIVHNIHLLKHVGIEDIVINTFHLGPKLMEALGDGTSLGVSIRYSVEETLLGTGGGVKHAEKLLGNEPFVLCNSDLITDLDLNAAIDYHFSQKAVATMVLLDDEEKKRRYANVGTDENGRLCQLPSKTTRTPKQTGIFTGIHILQPEAHQYLEPVFSGINQVLYPSLMEKQPDKAVGYYAPPTSTCWLDTGEVPIFWETSMTLLDALQKGEPYLPQFLSRHEYRETKKGFWTHELANAVEDLETNGTVLLGEGCDLGRGVKLGSHAVVGKGSTIGAGAHIERTVLLPGAQVAAGIHLTDTIVFGDRQLLHSHK
ncbi:MAG: NDP-sugar synthase [Bdellovibrionota bacterium]